MEFNISELIDKGFTTMVAVAAVYTVFKIGNIFTKYIPKLLEYSKEFIEVWNRFSSAMENNAIAIAKNTEITDTNHKHSEIVLRELEEVNEKFELHDSNALMIKQKVDELLRVLQEGNDCDEVLVLLRQIIDKLEGAG